MPEIKTIALPDVTLAYKEFGSGDKYLLVDGEEFTAVVSEESKTSFLKGSNVCFRLDPRHFHIFDSETGMRI